ncbi:hypothetical protein KDI_30240 [Dictyobacter arantiisoli]|uniref:Uncharacterized protein n=1 Tax=Dictyobacter arantiisoli TaxID=2014874 RepID=A0A5A5TD54_9CHLR|nr:hypothetical protein KDI_30240 [Dictyobacter arantiisoli]
MVQKIADPFSVPYNNKGIGTRMFAHKQATFLFIICCIIYCFFNRNNAANLFYVSLVFA